MSNTKFINLTPHAIVLQAPDGSRRVFEPSGTVARVSSKSVQLFEVDGIPFVKQVFGEVQGLPTNVDEDTFLIVSGMVLSALGESTVRALRVVAPATGPSDGAVRNAQGQIEAVTRFVTA